MILGSEKKNILFTEGNKTRMAPVFLELGEREIADVEVSSSVKEGVPCLTTQHALGGDKEARILLK